MRLSGLIALGALIRDFLLENVALQVLLLLQIDVQIARCVVLILMMKAIVSLVLYKS